jgi:Zn-finger nucleic acid-binding protein
MSEGKAWKDLLVAKEESYFKKQNDLALERISKRKENKKDRISPVSGNAMQECTIHGIVVDVCKDSGGIWLDAGELEEILNQAVKNKYDDGSSYVESFIAALHKATN